VFSIMDGRGFCPVSADDFAVLRVAPWASMPGDSVLGHSSLQGADFFGIVIAEYLR
jgi:hypothetical protein